MEKEKESPMADGDFVPLKAGSELTGLSCINGNGRVRYLLCLHEFNWRREVLNRSRSRAYNELRRWHSGVVLL